MGFNLGSALGSGLQGLLVSGGNPYAAAASGIAGGLAGSTSTIGNLGNGVQGMTADAYLTATQLLNSQNMLFQLQLQSQSQQFDEMTSEKSELMREQNELRSVAMEQRKADNEITKEFIKTIV